MGLDNLRELVRGDIGSRGPADFGVLGESGLDEVRLGMVTVICCGDFGEPIIDDDVELILGLAP